MKWKRTFRGDPDYGEVISKRGGWPDKIVIAILVALLLAVASLIAGAFLGLL